MSISDKLVTIAANEKKVYDKGYEVGSALYEALVMDNLEHAVIPEGAERTARGTFYERYQLKSIVLPEGFITVYDYFASNAKALETINLVDTIEVIRPYSFNGCLVLDIDKLPAGLKEIGAQGFRNCANVKFDKIPKNVTKIEKQAFYSCKEITTITFEGTPTSMTADIFDGCTNLKTIKVPWAEGAVANAPWGATNATVIYNYTPDAKVFYVNDGTEWVFAEGMTWGEFVDSVYNTGNAFCRGEISIDADGNTTDAIGYGAQCIYIGSDPVHPSSQISAGQEYYLA